MNRLTITRPDDWHLHLRDGAQLSRTVTDAAQQFARAIVMPNLKPPVTDVALASAYRDRILKALPDEMDFTPLMTLYLTQETTPEMVFAAKKSGIIQAYKLYPAGATTHSAAGVTNIKGLAKTFAAMSNCELPLLIHGEVVDPAVDIFDREAVFIERELIPLRASFPELRIVLEHITTQNAVDYILQAEGKIAATITAHHLWLNRNDLLVGGIKPHHYCLPVLKRMTHQQALIKAATSGNPKFFLGTDSAPHSQPTKESACGCAGIYTAHAAMPLYAEIFECRGALDKLEAFASHFGADFYGLPRNKSTLTLIKENWTVPESLNYAGETLIPFKANEQLAWRLYD